MRSSQLVSSLVTGRPRMEGRRAASRAELSPQFSFRPSAGLATTELSSVLGDRSPAWILPTPRPRERTTTTTKVGGAALKSLVLSPTQAFFLPLLGRRG